MSQVIFGALAAPLWQQLKCWPGQVELAQRQADAITLLSIHGTLSDAEVHRARRRLVKVLRTSVTKAAPPRAGRGGTR